MTTGFIYITPAQHHFYSVMSEHYRQRAEALPNVTFLKATAKRLETIVKTKTIRIS